MKTWIALTLVALAGCDLYFNGDDEMCKGTPAVAPAQQYRDPYTGSCIAIGGDYYCDEACGPCPVYNGPAQPDVDYGLCYSSCTGLDEGTCQATPGCYASYDENAAGDQAFPTFSGCWETPPSGPIQGGCQGLDAYSCSQHDNCAMVYDVMYDIDDPGSSSKFLECIDEPAKYCVDDAACGPGAHCDVTTCHQQDCPPCDTCGACPEVCYGVCVVDTPSCASTDCGPGYHCEDQCYPTDGQNGPPEMSWCTPACIPDGDACAGVDCGPGYECVEGCPMGEDGGLWCGAQCVPSGGGDPGSCTGSVSCDATPPACPSGTTPGITNGCWTGYCIPNADCGPNDPGECYGDVICAMAPPACPANTTAGIANGCYTGYCIPDGACEAAACETLTTESACTARMDCSAVYAGSDCTCDANGCTCQSVSFAHCESWWL
jgi:hypothetical protein